MNRFEAPYEKRKIVDYDAIIIISSFNRFEKLDGILNQLQTQKSKFTTKIIIYNDGSTDLRYKKLPKKYSCIYLAGKENNGKYGYWKSINVLLKKVSLFVCHAVIQIDDDFILCDNFINEVMTAFFIGKKINNKYVAINYHNNSICHEDKKIWFTYEYGVDGGSVFDFNFLEELQFKIDPIPMSRWRKNPLLSSGVWAQITNKINKAKLFTYNLNYSLACHNGNEDSKMNTIERMYNPLVTPDFKQNAENRKNLLKYLEYENLGFYGDLMTSPRCFFGIPYSSDKPYREKAFQKVYHYYKQLGFTIFIGESEEPFNRSAARNACIPEFLDWDIFVFLDADILVPLEQIEKAILKSHKTQEMVLAYEDLYLLDKDQTRIFYETNIIPDTWKKKVENQVSGAFAIPRKLWEKVGGQDERFKTWGGEDRAFYYSCAAFTGQKDNKRISGYAYHLWHEKKEEENFRFLSTNPLLYQYRSALGLSEKFQTYQDSLNPNSILPILKSRKGPLDGEQNHGCLSCPPILLSSVQFNDVPLKEEAKIAVTVPCFNSKDFVPYTLQTILNQTYENFLVFIISDADFASFDKIKHCTDSRVYFLRSNRNIGRYAIDYYMVNNVLPLFNCKYWAPIDSDDYVEPNYLEAMMEKINNCNVVFTDQDIMRVNGTKKLVPVRPYTNERKIFRSACMLSLWDLKFVIQNNLTNPSYRVGWDTLMTLTTQVIGKYDIVRKPLYHIIKRENSLTMSAKTGYNSLYRTKVRQRIQTIWEQIKLHPNNAHEILRRSRKRINLQL